MVIIYRNGIKCFCLQPEQYVLKVEMLLLLMLARECITNNNKCMLQTCRKLQVTCAQ